MSDSESHYSSEDDNTAISGSSAEVDSRGNHYDDDAGSYEGSAASGDHEDEPQGEEYSDDGSKGSNDGDSRSSYGSRGSQDDGSHGSYSSKGSRSSYQSNAQVSKSSRSSRSSYQSRSSYSQNEDEGDQDQIDDRASSVGDVSDSEGSQMSGSHYSESDDGHGNKDTESRSEVQSDGDDHTGGSEDASRDTKDTSSQEEGSQHSAMSESSAGSASVGSSQASSPEVDTTNDIQHDEASETSAGNRSKDSTGVRRSKDEASEDEASQASAADRSQASSASKDGGDEDEGNRSVGGASIASSSSGHVSDSSDDDAKSTAPENNTTALQQICGFDAVAIGNSDERDDAEKSIHKAYVDKKSGKGTFTSSQASASQYSGISGATGESVSDDSSQASSCTETDINDSQNDEASSASIESKSKDSFAGDISDSDKHRDDEDEASKASAEGKPKSAPAIKTSNDEIEIDAGLAYVVPESSENLEEKVEDQLPETNAGKGENSSPQILEGSNKLKQEGGSVDESPSSQTEQGGRNEKDNAKEGGEYKAGVKTESPEPTSGETATTSNNDDSTKTPKKKGKEGDVESVSSEGGGCKDDSDEVSETDRRVAAKKKKAGPRAKVSQDDPNESDGDSSNEEGSSESDSEEESKGKDTKENNAERTSKSKGKNEGRSSDDDMPEDSLSPRNGSPPKKKENMKEQDAEKNETALDLSSDPKMPEEGNKKPEAFIGRRSGNVTDFYAVQDLIGSGASASVYAAKNKVTGALRAAKEMKKSKENEANNKLVLNEFELLVDLDHPNLIKPYELFENGQYYFLVTDICKGGTLREALMKSGVYSEQRAALFMKQLLGCVDYIHSKGIVHRDLKPGNILLEERKKDKIKVIDFGMASRVEEGTNLSEPMGTPAYMAPEVLGMAYGKESDIWSCGCILFLMLSGQQAFKGKTTEETFTNIVTGEYSFSDPVWETISYDAKDFIKKLLTWDANARPRAAQALKHPWVASNGSSGSSTEALSGVVNVGATKRKQEFEEEEVDVRSLLKIATCTVLASQLFRKKERKKIDDVFHAIDIDNVGKLTLAEARIGYQAVLGRELPEDEGTRIFNNVDPAGTGVLHYPAFVLGALVAKNLVTRENVVKVFPAFGDNDGSTTVKELKVFLQSGLGLGKNAIKSLMVHFGKNGEDKVSLNDFLTTAAVPIATQGSSLLEDMETKSHNEKRESSDYAGKEAIGTENDDLRSRSSLTKSLGSLDDATTDSDMDEADSDDQSQSSLSIKLSATQFVSHRLGQLTDHYEIIDYIAKGTYGVVCSALHKETGTTRAIKELKKSKKNKAKNDLLLKEFHILKSLDHPNILQMHDKRHYYIVTGVSEGGDLHRELKQRGTFQEEDAAVLIKQILICLNYCHKHNIVHRDLKPGNILLEEHKNLHHIKICDFGESIISPAEEKLTEVAGTMAYMAPEVLGMSYGHKCDIWSCGVIAFLVLTGKQPLKGSSDQETFHNIVNGAISYEDAVWETLSPEAKDFVKTLLSWEENLRPTAEEALRHPWILKKALRKTSVELRQSTMDALSNLESFDARSKLRVATCTFIATQLMGKEEREKIDDVFRAIDLNNDGTLNRDEVKQGYETYFNRGLSDEEIDAIFKHVDADGTGELEYSEFLFGALDKQDLLSAKNLKKAFSIFADENGDITLDELKLLLKDSLTQDEEVDDKALNKLMKQVDTNQDGKISYDEFVSMALGSPTGSPSSHDKEKEGTTAVSSTADKQSDDTPSRKDRGPAQTMKDDSSRHLHKAIARASQKQSQCRSNRDPPIDRPGCEDPPSEEERLAMLLKKKQSRATDPEPSLTKQQGRNSDDQQESGGSSEGPGKVPQPPPSLAKKLQNAQSGANQQARRRVSPRDVRLEEACEGFDRVQEKIARLRMLLTARDTDSKPRTRPSSNRPSRDRKRSPNIETLDSAFTKLGQIQSKMRALQALVKSNQI